MKQYIKYFTFTFIFLMAYSISEAQVVRVVNNRVGINTTNPAYPLHVAGDMYGNWIRTAGQRGLFSQSYGIYYRAISTNYWSNRSDRGIVIRNRAGTNRGYIYHDNANAFGFLDSDGTWSIRMQRDSYTQFAINNISRMRLYSTGRLDIERAIDASGAVNSGSLQIGGGLRLDNNEVITNQNTTLYLQHVNNGDLRVDNTTLFVDASANRIHTPFIYDANNTSYYLDPSSVSRMNLVLPRVDNAGYCGTSASTWAYGYFQRLYRQYEYTLSDGRAKENIRGIDGALDKVLALEGKLYNYKASTEEEGMLNFDRNEDPVITETAVTHPKITDQKVEDQKMAEGEETAPEVIVEENILEDEVILPVDEQILSERDQAEVTQTITTARSGKKTDSYGFIAQEVQKIVPEAVDYDSENDVFSMSYSSIVPILVEAMKEQQDQITSQQKQLESQETKLENQQKQIDELRKLIEQK